MRWGSIGKEDRGGRESNHMKSDLADQGSVHSRDLEARRKQDEIRYDKVKRRPDCKHKTECSKCAKMADHKREQPKLSNHRVDTLHCQHKTNPFCRECQAPRELEWKGHGVVRLRRAEEDRHKLVEGNAMAMQLSAVYQ